MFRTLVGVIAKIALGIIAGVCIGAIIYYGLYWDEIASMRNESSDIVRMLAQIYLADQKETFIASGAIIGFIISLIIPD